MCKAAVLSPVELDVIGVSGMGPDDRADITAGCCLRACGEEAAKECLLYARMTHHRRRDQAAPPGDKRNRSALMVAAQTGRAGAYHVPNGPDRIDTLSCNVNFNI